MAATEITRTSVSRDESGYNLTDSADFDTLTAGAGNGIKWAAVLGTDLVVLKNDTAGAGVFTLKMVQAPAYSGFSVTIPDVTVSVAAGKTVLMRLSDIFKDSDGYVTIECDIAGKVLVLNLA